MINTTTKTCTGPCGDTKSIDEFPIRNGKPRNQCRVCTAAAQRASRRRLEDKRDAALSAEHERYRGRYTPDDGELFKENDRRLKKNAAQKRYRDRKKAEKAKLREAGELVDLPDDAREKVMEWARRHVRLDAEVTWMDDVLRRGHEPFQWKSWDRVVRMLYVRDSLFWQRKYTVSWMKRYLPPNAVAVIIKDRMAHRDWWLADRAACEARWLDQEQRDHDKLLGPRFETSDPESWADNPVLVAASRALDAEADGAWPTFEDYGCPEEDYEAGWRA